MLENERIFVSNPGIDPGVAALMQNANKGSFDPAAMMAMMNNGNGFGGNGGWWWIFIIVLFWMWGGNGMFGNRGAGQLASELNTDANTACLMRAIDGNKEAIGQLATTLNCDSNMIQQSLCAIQGGIDKVAGEVGFSAERVINAINTGDCNIISKLQDCCCTTQRSIDSVNLNLTKMSADNQLSNCQQTNLLVNTMNQNTLSLRDSNLANTQAIIQKIDNFENIYRQDKFDKLTADNLALRGQISQANQNQYIAATVQANTAPIVNRLNSLQGDVDGIKCKLPNTVSVPYPQLSVYNPEVFKAAAFGAATGYAAEGSIYSNGCGC